MRKCLIYSGELRTYEQVKENHQKMLNITEDDYIVGKCTDLEFEVPEDHIYNQNKVELTVVKKTLSMWKNMYEAFQLVPVGFAICVRMRYDLEFKEPILFENYEYNDNTVYIPEGYDYHGGFNDQFAFGNYEAMKKYYSVHLNHPKLYERGYTFHPELYLRWNLLDLHYVDVVRTPRIVHIKR